MSQYHRSTRLSTASSSTQAPNGGRECLVPGCHKKLCYAQVDNVKIYSRYCFRHTCSKTVSVQDGYHCRMPKEEGDMYCHNHMTCGADNCRELGYYPDETFPWYCPQHRCTKPDCLLGAHDLLSRRCESHQECAALQCTSPPDRAQNSNFCKAHTCTSGTCSLQAVAGNRCREHAKCSIPSCTRPCHIQPTTGRLESLCDAHLALKCAKLGCGSRKLHAHRRYCLDHGCRIPDCSDERYPGGGTLCTVHKCTFDACFEAISKPDDPKSLFCVAHACRTDGCLFSRRHPGWYCDGHTCEVQGCYKIVSSGKLCEMHGGRTGGESCRAEGCRGIAGERGFCKGRHACVVDGCQRARLSVKLGTEDEDDLVRCLKHDREERTRRALRERDEWKAKYDKLLADLEKMGRNKDSDKGERKRRHATVEDSEDPGDW